MAVVLQVFEHEHNTKDVARQEYELAKLHYQEVIYFLDWTLPGAPERFHAASDRRDDARRRYLDLL